MPAPRTPSKGRLAAAGYGSIETNLPHGWSEASAVQRASLCWFNFWLLLGTVCLWLACLIASFFAWCGFVSERRAQTFGLCFCRIFWRWPFALSPWVDIELQGLKNTAELGASGRPVLMIANHTSFFDTLLFAAFVPVFTLGRFRTLANSTLFELPLLGTILRSVGHIPVHFRRAEEADDFSTEPEMKASMMSRLDDHVRQHGGWVCMVRRRRRRRRKRGCHRTHHTHPPAPAPAQRRPAAARAAQFPEGRVHLGHGSANTSVLQPFRVGGMGVALQHDMELWGWATVGNNDCWPRNGVGGLPARVRGRLFPIARDGCVTLVRRLQEEDLQAAEADSGSGEPLPRLAAHAQQQMQKEIDALYAMLG